MKLFIILFQTYMTIFFFLWNKLFLKCSKSTLHLTFIVWTKNIFQIRKNHTVHGLHWLTKRNWNSNWKLKTYLDWGVYLCMAQRSACIKPSFFVVIVMSGQMYKEWVPCQDSILIFCFLVFGCTSHCSLQSVRQVVHLRNLLCMQLQRPMDS